VWQAELDLNSDQSRSGQVCKGCVRSSRSKTKESQTTLMEPASRRDRERQGVSARGLTLTLNFPVRPRGEGEYDHLHVAMFSTAALYLNSDQSRSEPAFETLHCLARYHLDAGAQTTLA
jgi:hypothetical protein